MKIANLIETKVILRWIVMYCNSLNHNRREYRHVLTKKNMILENSSFRLSEMLNHVVVESLPHNYTSVYKFCWPGWCKSTDTKPLSSSIYHNVFHHLRLALYWPQNNQWNACRTHKLLHIDKVINNEHIKTQKATIVKKERDKQKRKCTYDGCTCLLYTSKQRSS